MRPSPPLPFLAAAVALLTSTARPALADPPAIAPLPASLPSPPPPRDDTRALRFTGGVSLTAIGGISLLVGGILSVRALVSKADIGAHCDAALQCDLTGYTYGSQARDFALISTVFLTGGILVASGGVGLLLSSKPWQPGLDPRASRASAWIAPTPSGVVAGARW
jgi:hypothetical protein